MRIRLLLRYLGRYGVSSYTSTDYCIKMYIPGKPSDTIIYHFIILWVMLLLTGGGNCLFSVMIKTT